MTKLARLFVSLSLPVFVFAGCSGDDDDSTPRGSGGKAGKGGKGGSAGMVPKAGAGDRGGEAGANTGGEGGSPERGGASGQGNRGGSGGSSGDTNETAGSAGEDIGGGGMQIPKTVELAEASVEYATVAALDLAAVGIPANVQKSQIAVSKGSVTGLVVADQQIRFITPSDPGTDTLLELTVKASKTYVLPVRVHSARPSDVVAYVEPSEEGAANAAVPSLQVSGLGSTNAIVGNALSFSVDGAPALDAGASSGTIYLPQTSEVLDLAQYWAFDAGTNALAIDQAGMTALLGALPASDVEFTIGLVNKPGDFAYAWTFTAHKPVATLHGSVVDFNGMPTTALKGRFMGIRGLDNRTRRVVTVDDDGTFTVDQLVDGTFDVTLLDPAQPGFWKATVPIFQNTTDVNLNFSYSASSA
ncbi:MAG TPA: hypothetical protein VGQ57_07980, partial [Polyangiaceae bacterium]|nr:hypothetical protein [Polyangiaceae bacterium]